MYHMITATIVTVCYNEEKNIARTIESVVSQTTVDYEYIICDGMSKDRTVEIAEQYMERFLEKGVSFRIYSEKDKGIYDAMNKGIARANGEYIYFLNAGDWLCDANVMERFVTSIHKDNSPAIVYSDYYIVRNHRASRMICDDALLLKRMSIGHPAMLAKTDIMRRMLFDTSYSIAADYNFVLGVKMQGLEFKRLDFVASYFLANGVSSVAREQTDEEVGRILNSYGLSYDETAIRTKDRKREFINAIINIMPVRCWRFWTEKIKHAQWIEY